MDKEKEQRELLNKLTKKEVIELALQWRFENKFLTNMIEDFQCKPFISKGNKLSVSELIQQLREMPQNHEVIIEDNTYCRFIKIESIRVSNWLRKTVLIATENKELGNLNGEKNNQ